MGYSGLIAYSLNPEVIPDLGFFDLLLKDKNSFIVIAVLVLALSLTLSTIDTLINAISSLIIVNGDQINKSLKGGKDIKKTNKIIFLLSIVVFIFASKGLVFYICFY